MDLATREANELLLKEKRPWRCRQYEARVQSIAECLQSLYEIVLALSDSRSRHKYNLEAERTNTHKNCQARRRPKSLDETKSIRDWLGYETEESKETNKDVKKRLLDIETSKGNKDGEIQNESRASHRPLRKWKQT
ncbi:hypothetical protein EVAR_57856_1 [Eumeta japonica]|uniref:Uncharacterized protein n=1 Tax=Eumeta variegata TaxID=151549 RepID=A0A4C1ZFF9_EUMVA|nr:hypothetical protein EVAR_57856_1 [Eumeta japonica]